MTKPEVSKEVIEDFNMKIDALHKELVDKAFGHLQNSYINYDSYIKHANRLEISKRLFNHYFETGQVRIPD